MGRRIPFSRLNRRDLLRLVPQGVAGCLLPSSLQERLARAAGSVRVPAEPEGKKWRAKWIWVEGDPVPQNFYLYCRKTFVLEGEAVAASVDVTADSRYKLYLNGRLVGRGPARCDQRWQYYDSYDLTSFLHPRENVVSAIVHQYGAPSHSYTLGRGGFLLQGEVRERRGRSVQLDTDGSWRVLSGPPWDRESPRICMAIMWQEIYDARREPLSWQRPGYDESKWQPAAILGIPPVLPWEHLVARDIPFLLEEEWLPSAIVNSGIADPSPPAVYLDVPKLLGRSDGQVAYLFAYLRSPVEQQAALSLRGLEGGPPMMRLWLNGREPLQQQDLPGGPAASFTLLNLQPGWNELLIKLGRFGPRWYWDLVLGPVPGLPFMPVEWHADRDGTTSGGRAWVAGPYGQAEASPLPGRPGDFGITYEPEKVILGRVGGSAIRVPGKIVTLDFGPTKNIALLTAMEKHHPQPTPNLRYLEKLLKRGEGPAIISTGSGDPVPYVTLDFGKEVAGYVRLRLNGVAGGIVDLGYCETLVDGHVDTLRDNWSFADRYIMRDGPQEWELFFWKGFRYLQLTFRNCPGPVKLESVSLQFTSYPVRYRGAFSCSDPLLTKIWEVGRWTLQLCMHDGYEDCPWREQGQWCGDAQVEIHSNYVTFGDVALGTKCLRQIAQGQNDEGALPAEYPADSTVYPTRNFVPFGIPTFMAQWVSILLDHYGYTGDLQLLSELYPNVVRVMAYLDRFLDSDGLLSNVPGFVFLDWVPSLMELATGGQGQLTGMNCHYHRALLDASEIAGFLREKNQQGSWLGRAEKVAEAVNQRLWSDEYGAYAAGRLRGQLTSKLCVHDSILAVYAGVAPSERVSLSLANILDNRRQNTVQIGSPYFYFFYLRALRRAGRHQEALDAVRRAYGKMAEAGATTWWEHFGGFASLCHGWSSAPNSDLSAEVLGVKVTTPGFGAFLVEPHPADLTWARGVFPTPRGDVSLNWKRGGSTFELRVIVPMKSAVELSVPARSLEATRLSSNTRPLKQTFGGGRARYWVQAPGTFRVQVEGLA